VEHLGDVRVVHQGQRLPLGLEAGDDLGAVPAGLDDLEGDAAADRMLLLGQVDRAHAPLADLLEELVWADAAAGAFRARLRRDGPGGVGAGSVAAGELGWKRICGHDWPLNGGNDRAVP